MVLLLCLDSLQEGRHAHIWDTVVWYKGKSKFVSACGRKSGEQTITKCFYSVCRGGQEMWLWLQCIVCMCVCGTHMRGWDRRGSCYPASPASHPPPPQLLPPPKGSLLLLAQVWMSLPVPLAHLSLFPFPPLSSPSLHPPLHSLDRKQQLIDTLQTIHKMSRQHEHHDIRDL